MAGAHDLTDEFLHRIADEVRKPEAFITVRGHPARLAFFNRAVRERIAQGYRSCGPAVLVRDEYGDRYEQTLWLPIEAREG